MNDISLYVAWDKNPEEMKKEFKTIKTIYRNNIIEFNAFKNSIKESSLFACIISRLPPIQYGQLQQDAISYQNEETKCKQIYDQQNNDYNNLIQQETQILHEIQEAEKNVNGELEQLKQKVETIKKTYLEHKSSLNISKKMYEKNFGMNVSIEESEGEIFKAKVSFNKDSCVVFTINRETNKILDFETNCLSDEQLNSLKLDFKQTNNIFAVICKLRQYLMNKN